MQLNDNKVPKNAQFHKFFFRINFEQTRLIDKTEVLVKRVEIALAITSMHNLL